MARVEWFIISSILMLAVVLNLPNVATIKQHIKSLGNLQSAHLRVMIPPDFWDKISEEDYLKYIDGEFQPIPQFENEMGSVNNTLILLTHILIEHLSNRATQDNSLWSSSIDNSPRQSLPRPSSPAQGNKRPHSPSGNSPRQSPSPGPSQDVAGPSRNVNIAPPQINRTIKSSHCKEMVRRLIEKGVSNGKYYLFI